jgi:hypothetical protein
MPNVGDGLRTFDSGGDAMPVDVTDNGALSAPTGPRASYREDEPRALIDGSGQSSLTGTITGVGERSFIVIANACRNVTVWGSVRGTFGSPPFILGRRFMPNALNAKASHAKARRGVPKTNGFGTSHGRLSPERY